MQLVKEQPLVVRDWDQSCASLMSITCGLTSPSLKAVKREQDLLAYTDEETYRQAGPGGYEIRTSICIAAATEDQTGEIWFFEPIPIYSTTCCITTLYQK